MKNCKKPSCYKEAMLKDEKLKWEKAMQSKMNLLHKKSTWELVHLPPGRKTLPCKQIYKMKAIDSASQPRYMARLVANGFRQQEGVDFDEIFSPIAKMTTLKFIIALATSLDMELV